MALRIVEVGGHGDDCALDLVAEVVFRRFLEILKDHGGDFRRRVLLVADLDLNEFGRPADNLVGYDLFFTADFIVPPAHEALDRKDGIGRIGDLLMLGNLPDQPFALICESHDGGREP